MHGIILVIDIVRLAPQNRWDAKEPPDPDLLSIRVYRKTEGNMPIYEYECKNCSNRFEKLQPIMADPIKLCPNCGEEKVRRVIQPVGVIFKGSGWYITDTRKPEASGGSPGSSGSSGKSPEKSAEAAPEKSTEKAPDGPSASSDKGSVSKEVNN